MTFKPMTYLVSFTVFVVLFMALGGYVGYGKIADHFLTQSFLDATSINSHVVADRQGNMVCWEDKLPLQNGVVVYVAACNRSAPISIRFADESKLATSSLKVDDITLAANEHTEDVRLDQTRHYLYARTLKASGSKTQEITWLYKYDLQRRELSRRTAVNPIMLPAPFKP